MPDARFSWPLRAGMSWCRVWWVEVPRSEQEQARRLETAKVELAAEKEFDVTVVNDSVDKKEELAPPNLHALRLRWG